MRAVTPALRVLAGLLAVCLVGCDSDSFGKMPGVTSSSAKKKSVTSSESPGQGTGSAAGTSTAAPITHDITNSGASFQVKDTDLLRSSVDSCMGPNMLTVTDEMILVPPNTTPAPPALTDAKIRFLLPGGTYKAGDNIVDDESGNLVDTDSAPRTNIAADGLTDTYLRSLETIGNVVAGNCSMDNPNCQCASTEQALAMLTRCLPSLDPTTQAMADAASLLGAVCAINGPAGMRKAVASMIASYAFAAAR